MSSSAGRSPICPKALTLQELTALPIGTAVVMFCWAHGSKNPVRYWGVTDGERAQVLLSPTEVNPQAFYQSDMGLIPEPGGAWNPSYVVVLPTDVDQLPTGCYPVCETQLKWPPESRTR